MNDIKDTYIPINQVAKELNVSKWFLLQEIKTGNVTAYRMNGYKIKQSDLDAYIETKKVQPVSK